MSAQKGKGSGKEMILVFLLFCFLGIEGCLDCGDGGGWWAMFILLSIMKGSFRLSEEDRSPQKPPLLALPHPLPHLLNAAPKRALHATVNKR